MSSIPPVRTWKVGTTRAQATLCTKCAASYMHVDQWDGQEWVLYMTNHPCMVDELRKQKDVKAVERPRDVARRLVMELNAELKGFALHSEERNVVDEARVRQLLADAKNKTDEILELLNELEMVLS